MLISLIFYLAMKRKVQKTLLPVGMNRYSFQTLQDTNLNHAVLYYRASRNPPTRHTCQKYFTGQMHNLHSQMTNTDGGSWKVTHIVNFGCLVRFWRKTGLMEEFGPTKNRKHDINTGYVEGAYKKILLNYV